jgi:hypothetical protein
MSTLALELHRSVPRFVAQRTIGRRLPGLLAGPISSLRLVHREAPEPPAPGWRASNRCCPASADRT